MNFFRVGFKIKKIMKEEDLYKDRESQINAINNTFEKAKQPVRFSSWCRIGNGCV